MENTPTGYANNLLTSLTIFTNNGLGGRFGLSCWPGPPLVIIMERRVPVLARAMRPVQMMEYSARQQKIAI